jgi:hypothetical protein
MTFSLNITYSFTVPKFHFYLRSFLRAWELLGRPVEAGKIDAEDEFPYIVSEMPLIHTSSCSGTERA